MELRNNERIDDLQYKNLKIIQNEKDFCFGIDAVLLSDFAKGIKDGSYVVDLCTGNGIIAILISGKTKAKEIIGVEIQEHVAEMANRSVEMNNVNMGYTRVERVEPRRAEKIPEEHVNKEVNTKERFIAFRH